MVYLGLGSNLGQPREQLCAALDAIHEHPNIQLQRVSHFYASRPMGPQDQPDYVNAVAALSTALQPLALLDALQAIEQNQGRERKGERWGPRTLDLDILLFNDLQLKSSRLTLPHYGLRERAFVLVPLAEIAPTLVLPDGTPLNGLLAKVDSGELQAIADGWQSGAKSV